MTIKELEEKIKEANKQYLRSVQALNELQYQESSLEQQIEDLQDELYELREEQLEPADEACRLARSNFDDLKEEYNRRTRGLEGTKLPYPEPMTCG